MSELALQEPPLLVSWPLMVRSNHSSQVTSRGEIAKRKRIRMNICIGEMELDAEVQLSHPLATWA